LLLAPLADHAVHLVGATGWRARNNSNSRRCGQGAQVGLRYTGQILIEVDETTLRVYDQCERLIKTVPRTSRKEVRRHKDYGHHQPETG